MKKDSRTLASRARGLGSIRSGTEHFWIQRLTALANIPLAIFFIVLVVALVGKEYDQVHAVLANPFVAFVMALVVFSGVYHMKLGMQVIIEDYIHHEGLRLLTLALNIFFSVAMGAACALAILKIMLGG